MNAIPATATGQEQQGQQQHLAVVGGKGKPSKEALEAKRAETREKLEGWGLFEDARDRRSKAFDSWSVAECDSAIAWAQKQIQKNGEVTILPEARPGMQCDSCGVERAEHFIAGSPDPAEGMCLCPGCYQAATLVPVTMGPLGEGPWVDEQIITAIFHPVENVWGVWSELVTRIDEEDPEMFFGSFIPGVWPGLEIARAWDGFRGIPGAFRLLHAALKAEDARYRAYVKESKRIIRELEHELSESFGDIQRLIQMEKFQASLKDIAIVASIGNGGLVKGIVQKLNVVHADGKARESVDWKGKTKIVLTSTFPKKDHDDDPNAVIVTCEIKEELPSVVYGGRMYVDDEGEFIKVGEAIKQLRMLQDGIESQAQA